MFTYTLTCVWWCYIYAHSYLCTIMYCFCTCLPGHRYEHASCMIMNYVSTYLPVSCYASLPPEHMIGREEVCPLWPLLLPQDLADWLLQEHLLNEQMSGWACCKVPLTETKYVPHSYAHHCSWLWPWHQVWFLLSVRASLISQAWDLWLLKAEVKSPPCLPCYSWNIFNVFTGKMSFQTQLSYHLF